MTIKCICCHTLCLW